MCKSVTSCRKHMLNVINGRYICVGIKNLWFLVACIGTGRSVLWTTTNITLVISQESETVQVISARITVNNKRLYLRLIWRQINYWVETDMCVCVCARARVCVRVRLEIKPFYLFTYSFFVCHELLLPLYRVLCTGKLDVKVHVLLSMALG
jgi:hypothetical protein